MKGIDPTHPFFAMAWRRYAITASCFIWAYVEYSTGGTTWAMLFGAAGLYCYWILIRTFGNAKKEGE
jgi:hypothetical protein